jgi:hypothetical protein
MDRKMPKPKKKIKICFDCDWYDKEKDYCGFLKLSKIRVIYNKCQFKIEKKS